MKTNGMSDPQKIVIDFASGAISPDFFVDTCMKNSDIFKWIQSIVPDGKTCYKDIRKSEPDGYIKFSQEVIPYDFRLVFEQFMHEGHDKTGKYLNIHHEVCNLLSEAFPEEHFEFSDAIRKKFNFMLTACPEYIGGPEIDTVGIIDDIYDKLPQALSQSKRCSLFKEQLKTIFHVTDKKYPRWIQEPEWPMGKLSPMKFVKQQSRFKGEARLYTFQDVDTNEFKTIFQSH